MLCEQCQIREADVHVAIVGWPSSESTKHVCEACYPAIEAARVKSYAPQQIVPAPNDVEHITAQGYLDAASRAAANGAHKPALKQINDELNRLPATRARLALEFLRMACEALAKGNDPRHLIGLGGGFG